MVRFTKRITPDEVNDFYRDGDLINYTLPQNIIDLHSIAKYFTAEIDPVLRYDDNTYLKRFLPTNASAIIDYIQIKRDNEIVQTINEYALLNQIYEDVDDNNIKNSDGNKPDTVSFHDFDNNNNVAKTFEIVNTTTLNTYNYCINKWLGFLSGSSRYLDCRGKHIQITIKLSPKYITYRGIKIIDTASAVATTYDTDYHYKISKCFINLTVIKNENIELNNNIFFKDYTHFKGMKNTGSKTSSVKGRTQKNIEYILATYTDLNRNTDKGLQLQHYNTEDAKFSPVVIQNDAALLGDLLDINNNSTIVYDTYSPDLGKVLNKQNQLNNSIYFKRNGIDIKTNQFRVNGVDISPPYTALETFNNTKQVLNTKLQKVGNLASFINDFYISAQDYNSIENKITDVEWFLTSEGRNVGGEGHLFFVHNTSIQF